MKMKYGKVVTGTFKERPNRFIANVKLADDYGSDHILIYHVKDTSRSI